MTAAQRKLIAGIVPVIEQHGKEITSLMYKRMLEENPSLQNLFSRSKQDVSSTSRYFMNSRLTTQVHSAAISPKR